MKQEEIGALIKARRMKERVSLEDLAALTGVGINTLSRHHRGNLHGSPAGFTYLFQTGAGKLFTVQRRRPRQKLFHDGA